LRLIERRHGLSRVLLVGKLSILGLKRSVEKVVGLPTKAEVYLREKSHLIPSDWMKFPCTEALDWLTYYEPIPAHEKRSEREPITLLEIELERPCMND
jgi:hypothetical protein